MIFTTATFLFLFLPAVLVLYFLVPALLRNGLLLLASLFFYAWGDASHLYLLLLSILTNYGLALLLQGTQNARVRKWVLVVSVVLNLSLLGYCKYAKFFCLNLHSLLPWAPLLSIEPSLPLGISFYTFHALSYIIDVYRGQTLVERNLPRMALYIVLFPQLLAGPIIRYHQISVALHARKESLDLAAQGVRRLIVGLAKKVLLADTLAVYSDSIFALDPSYLTPSAAWIGSLCFALQLYFDFSGYSDMAIGMGKLFGFHFPENFNYPYVATTVSDYWTRWHMSLTGWFRSYLFFPLAQGSTEKQNRGYIVLVFLLVGLWHGANWNFLAFGLLHGLIVVVETAGLARWLQARPRWMGHLYSLLLIVSTLVFFRAPSVGYACRFWLALVGLGRLEVNPFPPGLFPDHAIVLAMLVGSLACLPLYPWLESKLSSRLGFKALRWCALLALLLLSLLKVAASTHRAFIYFQF